MLLTKFLILNLHLLLILQVSEENAIMKSDSDYKSLMFPTKAPENSQPSFGIGEKSTTIADQSLKRLRPDYSDSHDQHRGKGWGQGTQVRIVKKRLGTYLFPLVAQ